MALPPPSPPPASPPPPPPPPYDVLYDFNCNLELDFQHKYNLLYNDENLNDDPYSNINITSKFYDVNSLSQLCANGQPIYLSLNIQSLNSKFEEFKQFIIELRQKNVNIDVIALQETWDIQYPDLLSIPGFQTIVFKNRRGMRGGGWASTLKMG